MEIRSLGNTIVASLDTLGNTIESSLIDVKDDIVLWFINVYNLMATYYDYMWTWMAEFLYNLEILFINYLTPIKDSIESIPDLILDGLKEIFIPENDYVETSFNNFTNDLKINSNIDTSAFENLFNEESSVGDVSSNYHIVNVGSFKLKFFDSSFLVQGVNYFRPYIRGFIVLLLLLYNVKQFISFFGYDSGVVAGRTEAIESAKRVQEHWKG